MHQKLAMFIGLLLFAYMLAVASSSTSTIMIKSANEYSTIIDNFAPVIRATFNKSSCCNVLLSGESTTTKNMLKEFVRVYPHAYTLNQRTYYCEGYLVISTSVDGLIAKMESVRTASPNTELLILIDKVVNESTKLFNVSAYDVAKVNIVTPDGLWTLKNLFLIPAVFKKVTSYREIINEGRIVNLQGLELLAAALYKPPYSYLQSMEKRIVKGREEEVFIAKNETEVDGIEVKLFMLIAERLNFTWSICATRQVVRNDTSDAIGQTARMIKKVMRKEVDIAFTNFWLVLEKYLVINMTRPWGSSIIIFLVPRPRAISSFWALTRPLSPAIWAAFAATLIIQSIYVCTKAWIIPRVSKRFRNFGITLTELMGVLLGTYQPTRPQGLQLQIELWSFIGTILVTVYSSGLAATLASPRYEKRIDTAQDFIEANLSWGNQWVNVPFNLMFDNSTTYGREFSKHYQYESSEADRHRKILEGNYAIYGGKFFSNFYPEENVTNEDLTGFRLMKNYISRFQSSYAVQSWIVESVDTVILHLQQSGLVQYHVKDVIHRRTGTSLREVLIEHDGPVIGPKILHLIPLGAGFMMLFLGLFLSTVVFYCELRSVKNRSILQVLFEIKKNRYISSAKAFIRKRKPNRLILILQVLLYSVFYLFSSVKKILVPSYKPP